jgi:hypothetical protein
MAHFAVHMDTTLPFRAKLGASCRGPVQSRRYRNAAAGCRKTALSSGNTKEWIAMAKQWELPAGTEEGSLLLPSESHDEGELHR